MIMDEAAKILSKDLNQALLYSALDDNTVFQDALTAHAYEVGLDTVRNINS